MWMKNKKAFIVCLGGIVLLNILLYLPTINYDFISDDHVLIVENPRIKHFDGLVKDMISPFSLRVDSPLLPYWRPLVLFSYYLDYQIWGMTPGGFHLTNILVNTLNALLVFLIFFFITGKLTPASFIALIFSIHPSHVESAAWISGRTDLLSSMFILSSIYFALLFTRRKKVLWYWLSLAALIFALLSKEVALFLSIILTFIFYFGLPKEERTRKNKWKRLLATIPFWVITGIYVLLHWQFTQIPGFISKLSFKHIFLIIKTIGAYVRIILFPFFPAPYFSMREYNTMAGEYFLLCFLAIVLLAWIFKRRKNFKMSLSGLTALIFLVPVLDPIIIPAYPNITFRFAYLASIFAAVFFTEIILNVNVKKKKKNEIIQ